MLENKDNTSRNNFALNNSMMDESIDTSQSLLIKNKLGFKGNKEYTEPLGANEAQGIIKANQTK